ncbi:unnamed protein product [Mytilus coruscus]|uniref:Uncharacterized protein n=1 Tax=Mytilus coruscus TaxID=42192 RepID=A0A6J8AK74_MYTCO|nr:unnamed protein product [Mytilus coruscus]
MIPKMTISPESFSHYLPVDLTDFSTGPYSPELSSPARVIVERDAQEDVEYVLPQILEEELPPSLNLPLYTPPVVLSIQKSACNSCKCDSTIKELLCAVKTLTTAQETTFQQLQHFDKTISSISTEIACFRGQMRQYFGRPRPRFQNRRKNFNPRPQPKMKSTVQKKSPEPPEEEQ